MMTWNFYCCEWNRLMREQEMWMRWRRLRDNGEWVAAASREMELRELSSISWIYSGGPQSEGCVVTHLGTHVY